MIELGLKFTLAYLVGSVLGSLVVGYFSGGVDIRRLGSGNPGGTNALRTQGKSFAFCVMLIDVGKGVLAAVFIPGLAIPGVGIDAAIPRELVLYAVGVGAVIGHVFPIWFGFRGGKGGATAAGLLIYYAPAVALPVIGAWLAMILLTGFVGLATMAAAAGAMAYVGFARLPDELGLFMFTCLVAMLIVYTHRGNIRRMAARTEPRIRRFQKQ
ncbi:MAG TPA: glycerol-3-phosphate 1-O-acyltransferase PlsY [Gammaproteobacteria bacterium]|nr:glycerol-3-phosphate 1-O-acyltransferase PlsY [Gammaproteobacteria bacterium]